MTETNPMAQPQPPQQPVTPYQQPGQGSAATQPATQPVQPPIQPEYGQYAPVQPVQPVQPMSQPQAATNAYAQPAAAPQAYGQLPQGVPQYVSAPYLGAPALEQPWYGIAFGQAIARFYRKYAVFTGRASRGEFWWSVLYVTLVSIILSVVITLLDPHRSAASEIILGIWWVHYQLPFLAVTMRRLHDANISGGWAAIYFVPQILGQLWYYGLLIGTGSSNLVFASIFSSQGDFLYLRIMMAMETISFCTAIAIAIMASQRANPAGLRFDQPTPTAAQQPIGAANPSYPAQANQPQQPNQQHNPYLQ